MKDANTVFIIGAGLSGSVAANLLSEAGFNVKIFERRDHIGGNMYDFKDSNGILIHKYGPHVFHTNDIQLSEYMRKFGSWVDFKISCKVWMKDRFTPSPFNFQTIDDYFPDSAESIKSELREAFPNEKRVPITSMLNSKNVVVRSYAKFLFDSDYSLYTAKQWGIKPEKVDPAILNRVPISLSYEDSYFTDLVQMVPVSGYTEWFKGLLSARNIEVITSVNPLTEMKLKKSGELEIGNIVPKLVIYTGALDEFFNYSFGPLPYRSLKFKQVILEKSFSLPAPFVAYPEAPDFTRVTEYKQFPGNENADVGKTTLVYEYPLPVDQALNIKREPYYPIISEENHALHDKYLQESNKISNLLCFGRLADYKYYNMDQALQRSINCTQRWLKENL